MQVDDFALATESEDIYKAFGMHTKPCWTKVSDLGRLSLIIHIEVELVYNANNGILGYVIFLRKPQFAS